VSTYMSVLVLYILVLLFHYYSLHNMEFLRICKSYDDDDDDNVGKNPICDEAYSDEFLYPPNSKFIDSYQCLIKHQQLAWNSVEVNPITDRDMFERQCDDRFKKIVLISIATLAHGDKCVSGMLKNGILKHVKASLPLAMFTDQWARENVHEMAYVKQLDISNDASYYRSNDFIERYMGHFEMIGKVLQNNNYEDDNIIGCLLFKIMIMENIVFTPLFHCICYLSTLGCAQKLCEINMLAMRDEFIHYEHARLLSSKLLRIGKMSEQKAAGMLYSVRELLLEFMEQIIGDYVSPDGKYSLKIAQQHFDYTFSQFMKENGLFRKGHDVDVDHSESSEFMIMPQKEIRTNLMESTNTMYVSVKPTDGTNEVQEMFNAFMK